MEFFNKAKAVRLKSIHGKYLIADEDEETVRQSRNGSSKRARWWVEFVPGSNHLIRLKSYYDKYLTASDEPFMFSTAGKKVIQTMSGFGKDTTPIDWEPRTERFAVKLRTRCGKFLRANGGAPPWRNSITHDIPHRTMTQDWVLWEVEVLDILMLDSLESDLSVASTFSSFSSDIVESTFSETGSPEIYGSSNYNSFEREDAMELFAKAKSVRFRSHHDKYLLADDDEESVSQDRNGTIKNAKWSVEIVEKSNVLRFKSCYGKYLTASNMPFIFGMTGKKVLQAVPKRLDSSIEWEPIREGFQVKLRTRYGQYLRANGGVPPWRNSITHDIPHRTATQDWILWDVDVVEIRPKEVSPSPSVAPSPPPPHRTNFAEVAPSDPSSPTSMSHSSSQLTRTESDDSFDRSLVKHDEGRIIHYRVANENGEVEENEESFHFKGSSVHELKEKLEEETGLDDILVCSRNIINEKLYPLRLQLPPHNTSMHVVVVPPSAKTASNLAQS